MKKEATFYISDLIIEDCLVECLEKVTEDVTSPNVIY